MTTSDTLDAPETYDVPVTVEGMTNHAYHRHRGLGSTSLRALATRTPAHWRYEQDHPQPPRTEFDIGTVVHSLVLEQDESQITVIDADSWRTKAAKEAADEARAAAKIPLLTDQWDQVRAMRDAVMAHPLASRAFTGHTPEQATFWSEDGLNLKIRPDALHEGGELGPLCIDLKTCQSADPRRFGKTAADLGYHQQASHYQDGLRAATGDEYPFIWVLVEKAPPYEVSVVELDAEALDIGRRLNTLAKNTYRRCIATGEWPGYPDTGLISLPTWAIRQAEDLLEGEDL